MFVYQSLAFGFFLVLLPLLIHLINMMRHRRVKWATMQFLLASYKKHRRWVWLKQMLLLLTRMAVIAAIVAMLAQLITPDQWANLLGSKVTHHYVLLDDSYSMSDRVGSETVFDRAKRAVGQIADRASRRDMNQKFTLLRFSRASRLAAASDDTDSVAQIADMTGRLMGGDFKEVLDATKRTFDVTQLAAQPAPALRIVQKLIEQQQEDNRIVYIVSDFRAGQWENPAEMRNIMRRLEKTAAEIHLIRCVKSRRPNLGITYLGPDVATRAAGVPLPVVVSVKNHGAMAVKNVQLTIRGLHYDPPKHDIGNPVKLDYSTDELPTELIDKIDPGQTVTRRVQVYFSTAGQHVIEALLPDDSIAADNRRYCVVEFPPGEPVLLIDGHPQRRNAYYLSSIFHPGQRINTGIIPAVESVAYLRDVPAEQLIYYSAIYLLNVNRLDEAAIEKLESYVRQGGGLAFFLGPDTNIAHYNEKLHIAGQGLLPVPLDRQDLLGPKGDDKVPDFEVVDHPVFHVFAGQNAALLGGINIEQYFRVKPGWAHSPDSTVRVLATLRNRMPLVVQRQFGQGRVIAFLSTLAPDWNNWARDPSFIVTMLNLQPYLAAPKRADRPLVVGSPLVVTMNPESFRPGVAFIVPGDQPTTRKLIQKQATLQPDKATEMKVALGHSRKKSQTTSEVDKAGIYEAWTVSQDGTLDVRRYALNVQPSEGDLDYLNSQQLATALKPAKPRIHDLEDLQYQQSRHAGFDWSELILYGLICLLLGEQALAYSASYHPARGGIR